MRDIESHWNAVLPHDLYPPLNPITLSPKTSKKKGKKYELKNKNGKYDLFFF